MTDARRQRRTTESMARSGAPVTPAHTLRVRAGGAARAAAAVAGCDRGPRGAATHSDGLARERRPRRGPPIPDGSVELERVIAPTGNLSAMDELPARAPAGRAEGSLLDQRRRSPPHSETRPRQEPALA